MNTNVDVLAVIQGHIAYYEGLQRQARDEGNNHYADELDEDSGTLNQLRVARDEVADLIEAADRLINSCDPESRGWPETVNAIARVRGAQ